MGVDSLSGEKLYVLKNNFNIQACERLIECAVAFEVDLNEFTPLAFCQSPHSGRLSNLTCSAEDERPPVFGIQPSIKKVVIFSFEHVAHPQCKCKNKDHNLQKNVN
ncbi:MAG: hypothetical protein RJB13_1620 [Pseudomonadota bacterium]